MTGREKYERLVALAGQVRREFAELDLDGDEPARLIERAGGKCLPPINGTLNIPLQETKVN